MNRLIVCAIMLGLAAYAAATKFTDCGSTTGKATAVDVTDCPEGQDICILKKNTQPVISITFTSNVDSSKLKAIVHGVVEGVPIIFPLPQPDACKSGVVCPIKKGESYTYSDKFNVRRTYPSISVGVRFEFKDENNNDVACIQIPSKIQ